MRWRLIKGESDVWVPETDDRSESKDLMDMAVEKSHSPLRKEPRPASKVSQNDRKEFLRDQKAFSQRQKQANTKKFY